MGIPQYIVAVLLGLQVLGSFLLDGTPRKNPNWDGNAMLVWAIAYFALLSWGGFFKFG